METKPAPPLLRSHSTARMEKLVLDGESIVPAKEISANASAIRHASSVMRRRRVRDV